MKLQGRPTNLNPKGGGENSMSETAGTGEVVYPVAGLALTGMVKATLLESQFPVGQRKPTATTTRGAAEGRRRVTVVDPHQSTDLGHRAASTGKGTNGAPVAGLDTLLTKRNVGFPKGREPQGNGVSIVVAGVTPRRGVRESRMQGEGRQVGRTMTVGGA